MGQLAVLLAIMASLFTFTDLPEKLRDLFDESVKASQQIATAGDLRSMSNMLDYHYFKKGRYPRQDRFDTWLAATFKEANLKELSLDHWGTPYRYVVGDKQKSYQLTSAGQDMVMDTDDDLRVTGP